MIKDIIDNKVILISGGSGTLGKALTKDLLQYNPKKIIIISRNEKNQYDMEKEFQQYQGDRDILRYILCDIRDLEALNRVCNGVDYIIHTAALKHVDKAEYNVEEYYKTIIIGSMNIIKAAIENEVSKVIALSTDKASSPSTLYGACKMTADRLFQSANVYAKSHSIQLVVVRYGNVMGSNGSIIPYYKKLISEGKKTLPVTNENMTRFWITLPEAIKLIYLALEKGTGGEIFVSNIPSFRIIDLVKALDCDYNIIGRRENEKLHEELISEYDNAWNYGDYYIIYPNYNWYDDKKHIDYSGKEMHLGFRLASNNNRFMTIEEIREKIK